MTEKMVTIPESEYLELKGKAAAYDKYATAQKEKSRKAVNSLTPEERRERAKKAVAARIAKYGQKRRSE